MTTIFAVAISMYYVYKETREYVVKYLESADDTTLRYMKIFITASIGGWALILRYYIMEP
jgi:hypothetical protein